MKVCYKNNAGQTLRNVAVFWSIISKFCLNWALYLRRHCILVEIFAANQPKYKFLCLPLISCQNVSQEINQFTLIKKGKYEITQAALIFTLLKFID